MKKTIIAIALFMVAGITAQAQDEAFKKDAVKLAGIQSKSVEASMSQIYTMIPEDKVEAFKKELDPIMKEFYTKIGEKSMEFYTHDEVKEILKFYGSKVGQKHLEVQEKMTKETMGSMAQELQMKLMPLIQKYTQGG
jgi:hypothetical protein